MPDAAPADDRDFAEVAARIESWHKHTLALEHVWHDAHSLMGVTPDSALGKAIWHLADAYTKAVAEACGDQFEWLAWYRFECKLGAHPLAARLDGDERLIRTPRDLAQLLADLNARDAVAIAGEPA